MHPKFLKWPVVGWGFVLFVVSFVRCPQAARFRLYCMKFVVLERKEPDDDEGEVARAPRLRPQSEARTADVAARADCKDKAAAAGGATRAPMEREATGEAAWAPLLRLEREAGVTADAARAASGGRMVEGQEEDSEEEHDVLRTYMEIYDDNFDYEF